MDIVYTVYKKKCIESAKVVELVKISENKDTIKAYNENGNNAFFNKKRQKWNREYKDFTGAFSTFEEAEETIIVKKRHELVNNFVFLKHASLSDSEVLILHKLFKSR